MQRKTMEDLIAENEIARRNREAEEYICHVHRVRARKILRFFEIATCISAAGWVAIILAISCR